MKKLLGKAATSSHKTSSGPTPRYEDEFGGDYNIESPHPRHYHANDAVERIHNRIANHSESATNYAQPQQLYTGMGSYSYSYSQEATPTADHSGAYSAFASAYPSYGGEEETGRKEQPRHDPSGRFNNRSSHGKSSSSFGHAKSASHSSSGHAHHSAQSYASHGTSSSADDYSFIQHPSRSSGSHEMSLNDQPVYQNLEQHRPKGVSAWAAKTFGRGNDSANSSSKIKSSKSDSRHLSQVPDNHLVNHATEQADSQSRPRSPSKPKRVKSLGRAAGKARVITHWDTEDHSDSPDGAQEDQSDYLFGRSNNQSLSRPLAAQHQQNSEVPDSCTPNPDYDNVLFAPSSREDVSNLKDKKPNKKNFWAGITGTSSIMTRNDSAASDGHIDAQDSQIKDTPTAKTAWYDIKARALSMQQQQQQNNKPEQRQPVYHEGDITAKIGWLCAQESLSPAEWSLLPWLAQTAAQSDASAKEAARAIRKELKWGQTDTQKRAVKVWAFLALHSSDAFRQQIASKKFLEIIEHTVAHPKVSLSVKEHLIDAWAILAYLFKDNADLDSVTKSYNKTKPNDKPHNGTLVDIESHEIFRVPTETSGLQRRSGKAVQKRRSRIALGSDPHALSPGGQRDRNDHTTVLRADRMGTVSNMNAVTPDVSQDEVSNDPTKAICAASDDYDSPMVVMNEEDVQELTRACEAARADSSVLIDVITNDPETSTISESAAEFIRRVHDDHELLSSQIQWVSVQADTSRKRLAGTRQQDSQIGPDAHFSSTANQTTSGETREELLLADMLNAIQTISSALSIVEQAREDAREREEERRVTELSKVDFRVDRSALQEDAQTGELYSMDAAHGAGRLQVPLMDRVIGSSTSSSGSTSTSRAHSPRMGPRPLPSTGDSKPTTRLAPSMSRSKYDQAHTADSLAPPTQRELASTAMTTVNSSSSQSSAVRLDRPSLISTGGSTSSTGNDFAKQRPIIVAKRDDSFEPSPETESKVTHISEKAMGKRRAVSPTESTTNHPATTATEVRDEWHNVVGETGHTSHMPIEVFQSLGLQDRSTNDSDQQLRSPPALPPMPARYLAERQLEQNSRNPFRPGGQLHGNSSPLPPSDQRDTSGAAMMHPCPPNPTHPSALATQRPAPELWRGLPPPVPRHVSHHPEQAGGADLLEHSVYPFARNPPQHPLPAQDVQRYSSSGQIEPTSRVIPPVTSSSFQVGQVIPRGVGNPWHGSRDVHHDDHNFPAPNPHHHYHQSRNHHQEGDHVKTFAHAEGRLKNPFEN
ncbi:unnamed protein product [Sympodiomycopsis kandeliae]